MSDEIASKYPGIRYRKHATRKHGVMLDRYFFIRHTANGKRINEGVGWLSDGWTEKRAAEILAELSRNKRTGKGPKTLKEKRAIEEAAAAAAKKKADILKKQDMPFGQFFEEIVLPDRQSRLKPDTVGKEESHLKVWLNPVVGELPFRLINLEHVETIRQNLVKAGRSPRMQQYVFRTFSTIWNHAEDHGLTEKRCPTKVRSFRLPKVDNEKQRYLTAEEEKRLLLAVRKRGEVAYRMAMLSLDTGVRFKEIASLSWGCVDMDTGTIRLLDSKGADRYVPMTQRVRALFESMPSGRSSDLVFPDKYGSIMQQVPSSFKRGVDDAKLNDGIENPKLKASFHTLRHTYASRLVQAGVDLYRVQKLLGHSTPVVTQRYAKLADTDLKEAVEKMERKNEVDKKQSKRAKIIKLRRVK